MHVMNDRYESPANFADYRRLFVFAESLLHPWKCRPGRNVWSLCQCRPNRQHGRGRRTAGAVITAVVSLLAIMQPASGQQENPVYVDDSPRAWELFQRAGDQRDDNTGEAARLYQEILDEYAMRLMPVSAGRPEQLTAARLRVMQTLRRDDELLERYRLIEQAEAERLLNRGELERLAWSRPLTRPGLDALFQLSQQAVEQARFDAARFWLAQLEGHPDLAEQSSRTRLQYWSMRGVAGWFAGEDSDVARARHEMARIDENEAKPFLAELDGLEAAAPKPVGLTVSTVFDPFAPTAVEELVGEPIWTIPLEQGLYRRQYEDEDEQPDADPPADRVNARLLTVSPAMNERTVFINEGHTIRAIDRHSHHERWSYTERSHMSIIDNRREVAGDLNMFDVKGRTLVTLTGHAHTHHRSSSGKVVCLDAESGSFRWQVELSEIGDDDELDGLFAHGRPLIADDRVHLVARRVSRQNVSSTYVVALDLEDGSLAWLRHIASSGGVRTNLARPFSSLIHDSGSLFLESAVGAMARLDAATGQVQWLRRYPVPINPGTTQRMPWEVTTPIMTRHGLAMIEHGRNSRMVIADPELGDPLATYRLGRGTTWGDARYLVGDEEMLFAVGSQIRAFHVDHLEEPLWVFPQDDSPAADATLYGRVQAGEELLVIPTREGQYFVDRSTGEIRAHLPDATGNPLVFDEQLLVAGPSRLKSYMPLRVAEAMIRRQIDEEPDHPDPAMTLLELGLRAEELALVLEGAQIAADRMDDLVEPHPDDVERLFTLLLNVSPELLQTGEEPIEAGETIHTLMSDIAVEPEQQVEHSLAHGRWIETHDPAAAIRVYQRILEQPELRRLKREVDDVRRPASDWAAAYQLKLVGRHGDNLYEDIADDAWAAFDALPDDAGPGDFLAILDQYPLAPAAVEAAAQALDAVGDEPKPHEVLANVQHAYRLLSHTRPDAAVDLLERYVDAAGDALADHERDELHAWFSRQYGEDRVPERLAGDSSQSAGVETTDPSAWNVQPSAERTWSGRLLKPKQPTHPSRHNGLAIIHTGESIRAIDVHKGQTAWRADAESSVELLRSDERGVVLWLQGHGVNPRIMLLDPQTGEEQWVSSRLSRLLDDGDRLVEPPQGTQIHLPDGRPFDPREAVPVVLDDKVLIVRRTGSIACFDLSDGTLLWTRDGVLGQVHLADTRSWGIVLAGSEQPPQEGGRAQTGRLVALDPDTGRTVQSHTPLDDQPIHWMEIGPLGIVAYRSGAGVEVCELLTGRVAWSNGSERARQAVDSWMIGHHVLLADENNAMRFLHADRGTAGARLDEELDGDWSRSELVQVAMLDGDALVQLHEELARFNPDGELTGRLVVSEDRQFRLPVVHADGRLIVLNQIRSRQERVGDSDERRMVHRYVLYIADDDGRLISDIDIRSVEDPIRSVAVEAGHLLFSTQATTWLVDITDQDR